MSLKSQGDYPKFPVPRINHSVINNQTRSVRSSVKTLRPKQLVAYEDRGNIVTQSTIIYLIATTMVFISAGLLIVSVASPYWTESDPLGDKDAIEALSEFEDEETRRLNKNRNAFNNIGLWQACFYRFKFILDESKFKIANGVNNGKWVSRKSLTGCFTFWSNEILFIQDWLLPPWFRSVQVFACLGLAWSLILILVLFISFVKRTLKTNMIFLLVVVAFTLLTSIFVFTSSLVYGLNALNEKWLPRQDLNSFSWSYWAHASSVVFLCLSASLFLVEAKTILHHNRAFTRKIISSTRTKHNIYEI